MYNDSSVFEAYFDNANQSNTATSYLEDQIDRL